MDGGSLGAPFFLGLGGGRRSKAAPRGSLATMTWSAPQLWLCRQLSVTRTTPASGCSARTASIARHTVDVPATCSRGTPFGAGVSSPWHPAFW